jgi:hypothetical protein
MSLLLYFAHHILMHYRHAELINNKKDVLMVISHPQRIFEGRDSELLAIREIKPGKWLVVAYRELINDGFVITAYSTRRLQSLTKRRQLWP